MDEKPRGVEALARLFHEPHRLALMCALCRAQEGMTFTLLKEECDLTDGNLSRHIKALEDAGAVRMEKTFAGLRPRTTVYLTTEGRDGFVAYLGALEDVLASAAAAVGSRRARRPTGVRAVAHTA